MTHAPEEALPPEPQSLTAADLFSDLRIDPAKVRDGVWKTHPESGDQFRGRRLGCVEMQRAYIAAKSTIIGRTRSQAEPAGEDRKLTDDEHREALAMAIAAGMIVDWKLAKNPGLAYDSTLFARCLMDPQLADLLAWIQAAFVAREDFQPNLPN